MARYPKWKRKQPNRFKTVSKWIGGVTTILILLFIGIGLLTGAKTTYRLYSETIQEWTTQLEGRSFIHLFEMENRQFSAAHPDGDSLPGLSTLSFQLLTSLTPNDPRSLLGREIPGLASYNSEIIIAGEGTDYTTLPIESEPPQVVLEKGEVGEIEAEQKPDKSESTPNIKEDRVFIYNTHNTESFLPHLPEGQVAYDGKVNITLVSQRLADSLEQNGVGASINASSLEKQTYDTIRPVVKQVMSDNKSLKYFFDLHRDSVPKDVTTTTINGKSYARFIFVVGAEHSEYEKNLKLASKLHERLEKEYPGISRGVITKKGSGVNGVYNQDLNPNALVVEFGGKHNNLDELYRSADAFAEVFGKFYFEAEKVSNES